MTESYSENIIESAVHQRCADSATLSSLIRMEQIFTGTQIHRKLPYISIQRKNARPLFVTNLGVSVDEAYFVFEIRHTSYEIASGIVTELKKLFDAAVWESSDNSRLILRSEIAENDAIQREDATWEWGMTMRIRLLRMADFE